MSRRNGAAGRQPHIAILTTSGGALGGMETFTRRLIGWLLGDGWTVTLGVNGYDFTEGGTRLDPAGNIPADDRSRLSIAPLAWVDPKDLSGDRRYRRDVVADRCRWFRALRPDVALFIQSSNTPFRASILGARLAGVRVVTTQRTMPARLPDVPSRRHCLGLLPGLGLHRRRLIWSAALTARLADRVIYNSLAVRRLYETEYSYPSLQGMVIRNAVSCGDPDAIEREPSDRLYASESSRTPRMPVTIGYIGRLGREKRVDILLQALAALPAGLPVSAQIHGVGPEEENLQALTRQLGLSARVSFCGACHDSPRAFRSIDIAVLCSPRESSSNMVLEAMAAGCAVVVTRAGGLPELIDDGDAGVGVDALDVEQLTHALSQLITDEPYRLRLARFAQKRVAREHDPAVVASQWLHVLGDIAGCAPYSTRPTLPIEVPAPSMLAEVCG